MTTAALRAIRGPRQPTNRPRWAGPCVSPLALLGALVVVAAPATGQGTAVRAFLPGSSHTIGSSAEAWHRELEEVGDYAETWYFLVQARSGALLIAAVSITNLGLRTFDGVYDIHFYGREGSPRRLHREHSRDELQAAHDKLDVRIGGARVWRDSGGYHLHVDDPEMQVRLSLRPQAPAHQFGDGYVRVGEDGQAFFAYGMSAPRVEVQGTLSIEGREHDLGGSGYHDHSWATVKLPSLLASWDALRVLHSEFSLVTHDQAFASDVGGGHNRFGVLGAKGKLIGEIRDFKTRVSRWRTDPNSGYPVPASWHIDLQAADHHVAGTITEERFLDSIDILGVLSWPIRMAVKTFYASPYTIRYFGRYDLRITDAKGTVSRIQGLAPYEITYYDAPPAN